MKITDVKSYLIKMGWDDRPGKDKPRSSIEREFVFVQIDTDEGITGWGEITNYPGSVGNRAIQKYVMELKDFLILLLQLLSSGFDPLRNLILFPLF